MEQSRRIKVFKITMLVIDTNNDFRDADDVKNTIENTSYANHCLDPDVKSIETREVDWLDSHELNQHSTADKAYRELFEKDANAEPN